MIGKLYLVATPIGNLEDMTLRGLRILKTVDLIGAEDTRHTGKLLHHFEIKTPMMSYHEHNQTQRTPHFLQRLQQGDNIALVTDAGTPAISDPGYYLVVACIEANLDIVPIPGANAGINALIASGLPTDRFVFEGFLPTKKKLRDALLLQLRGEERSMIFYEAPHKLRKTLADFAEIFGLNREITLARELTKLHEDFWRGTVGGALDFYQSHEPRGEFCIIVRGICQSSQTFLSEAQIKESIEELRALGMTKSEISQHLAKSSQLSRQEIYRLTLNI